MSGWRGALTLALVLAALPGAAVAAPADLDAGFGTGGIRTIDRGGAESIGDMAIQPDGKIVVVGGGADGNFLVARLNPNGSPDGGFDGDGFASIDFGGAAESAYSVALQSDGKIVVAGRGGANAAVARLNPNGSLDGGFAVGGKRLLDYGPNVGIGFPARAVEVDRDGKIVVAGSGPEGEFTLTRLNPDGGFDATVDVDGVRTVLVPQLELTDPERDLFVNQIGFQRDGKIMLAGNVTYHLPGGQDVYAIAATRSNLDGSLDPTFGMGGRVGGQFVEDIGLFGSTILVQPDDSVLLGANAPSLVGAPVRPWARVRRLRPNGLLDTGFGTGGRATVMGGDVDQLPQLGLQANGKIVMAFAEGSQTYINVARLQPGGTPDATFGGTGKTRITVGESNVVGATAVQSDGKLLVAGSSLVGGAPRDLFVARLEGDPVTSPGPVGGGPGGGGRVGAPPRCGRKRATIVGTAKRDRLKGTRKADVIVALGGNDIVSGGAGNDVICAGAGNDSANGGKGNDRLLGEGGRDALAGSTGKDSLAGGSGADRLNGGAGNDLLDGGAANDLLKGAAGADRMFGRSGRDRLVGGAGRDRQKQ